MGKLNKAWGIGWNSSNIISVGSKLEDETSYLVFTKLYKFEID